MPVVTTTRPTHCADCGADLLAAAPPPGESGASGYATTHRGTPSERHVCYDCAAKIERAEMIETGHAFLYEAHYPERPIARQHTLYLTNWTGRLRFETVGDVRHGRHNLAGTRIDVWFMGPDGREWHGWRAGDSGTYLRCRRNGPAPARQPATEAA